MARCTGGFGAVLTLRLYATLSSTLGSASRTPLHTMWTSSCFGDWRHLSFRTMATRKSFDACRPRQYAAPPWRSSS
eukprot:1328654-Pyramimonas_sp.AAC.1